MNGRGIVTTARAICFVCAFGCGLASINRSSAAFDTDDAIDRPVTIMLNAPSASATLAAVKASSADQTLRGNPMWGIPLELLRATRQRPLFSPSRRPPAAVSNAPVQAVKAVTAAATPEPTLSLVGTVVGGSEGYAVFINTTTHDVVRLKTGEGENGWFLRSVRKREAVLEKNDRVEVIALPPPDVPK
jgi:hypothetical protein